MTPHKLIKKIVLTEKEVIKKIQTTSKVVKKYYQKKEKPLFLGILKGCMLTMSHLIINMDFDVNINFILVKRTKKTTITNDVVIQWNEKIKFKNRNILIVEDVIDSGVTLHKIKKILLEKGAKEVKTLVLIDKPNNRKVDFKADFVCTKIDTKEWLVGWGFDVDDKMRNLPYIGYIKDEYKG